MAGADDTGRDGGGVFAAEPDADGMHVSDAIRLNILFDGLTRPRPEDDDEWLVAAIQLAGRAEDALQVGVSWWDIVGRYRPAALIKIARVIDGKLICGCGHAQIDPGPRCEACGRDLLVPEAAPARVEQGRVLCPDCGGDELLLYGGTTNRRPERSLPSIANAGWHVAFGLGAGDPCPPPPTPVGNVPWLLPCVMCASEACRRLVQVPENVRVTFGDWTVGGTAARPGARPPEDSSAAASGTHIVHARVNGVAVAFLAILPAGGPARERALATYEAISERGSVQARPAASPIGERVRTLWPIDRYPHFVVAPGSAGVVTTCEQGLCTVRLDDPVPGMEEWDNELCFTTDDAASQGLTPPTAATAMWASCEPEPLR
jgi:hypothetical protein